MSPTTTQGPSAAWSPTSWRDRTALQQPDWPDAADHDAAVKTLSGYPPLVFAGEARHLTSALGRVAEGGAFLLQAGDCAESFDSFSADSIRERLKVILQMAVVLTYSAGVPTVNAMSLTMWPRKLGSSTPSTVSVGAERGLPNCPAMRPTFTVGTPAE